MTARKRAKEPAPETEKGESNRPEEAIRMVRDERKTEFQQFADVSMSPITRGTAVCKRWSEKAMGEIGINEAMAYVQEKADAAAAGDLNAAKAMLVAQAMTLDSIFNDMAGRAATLVSKTPGGGWSFGSETMETCTRIAFKAQAQCRATLQTLGELVHPRTVVIAKQANMTNGPQQVNNGAAPPRAQESQTPANELLEANPSERLESGTQGEAGGVDPWLATVGALNRASDTSREVHQFAERRKARAA